MVWKSHFIMAVVLRGRIEDHELDEDDRERTAAMARRLADRLKRRHPGFSYEWFFGACGLDHWGDLPPFIPSLRQRVEAEPNGGETGSEV